MRGIWAMLMGHSRKSEGESVKDNYSRLYQNSSNSIDDQDALIEFYEDKGMIGGTYRISDEEAQRTFQSILSDENLSASEKDAYLSALDVAVQNHHEAGLGAEIMNQILAAQYELLVDDEWKALYGKDGGE